MFFNKGTNVSALIICWGFQRFLKIPQDILSLKGSASTTVCNLLDSAALCICIYVFVFVYLYPLSIPGFAGCWTLQQEIKRSG